MLYGLLVDLVPFGETYLELQHTWENSVASFWSDVGDHQIVSRAQLKAHRDEREYETDRLPSMLFGVQAKDGTPIGLFGMNFILFHHRLAMFGAQIGNPAYWGNGYGTDALLLMADFAFDWLDLRKICLETMSLNARVVRQMEKVGFVLEGRRQSAVYAAGEYYDGLVYGLLREEWPGREAMIARLGLVAR